MRNLEIVDRFLRLNMDAREIVPSREVREGYGEVALPIALFMELELRIGFCQWPTVGQGDGCFPKILWFFALFCVALVMGSRLWRGRFFAGVSDLSSNLQKLFHNGEELGLVLREAKGVVDLAV